MTQDDATRPTGGDPQEVAAALHAAHPEFDEVPVIEQDETVPPRPEEEAADAARADRATG